MPQFSKDVVVPIKGIDYRESETREDGYASDLRNVRTTEDRVSRGPGSSSISNNPLSTTNPRTFFQASFYNGTEHLLAATATKVNRYDPAANDWVALTGTYTGGAIARFSFVNIQDRICWSNGVENIQQWTGSGAPTSLVTLASPTLLSFNDRIVALYTVDVVGTHNARAQWCVNGNITDWAGLGSGFLEVVATGNAPLTGGFVLGTQCMMGKRKELIELVITGDANSPFAEATRLNGGIRIAGTGILGRYTTAGAEGFMMFVGEDDVYKWEGSGFQSVGARVNSKLHEIIDYNNPDKLQGVVQAADSEYWILVSDSVEGNVFIYDYRRDRWYRDDWPNVRSLGVFQVGVSLLADINRSQTAVVGFNDGATERENYTLFVRKGATYDSYIDTPDYVASKKYGGIFTTVQSTLTQLNTLYEFNIEASPNITFEIGYSIDRGATWKMKTVSTDSRGIATIYVQAPFNRVRVRTRSAGTSAWSSWRTAEMVWRPSGMRL